MSQVEREKSINDHIFKWLGYGLIIMLVLSLLWASRQQLLDLLHFFRDREAVTAYLEPLGWWGPLLYLVITQCATLYKRLIHWKKLRRIEVTTPSYSGGVVQWIELILS